MKIIPKHTSCFLATPKPCSLKLLPASYSSISQIFPPKPFCPPHEDSRDTQSSAENIAKIVRAGDFAGTALVTVGYHAERAADEFDRSGVQLEAVVAAEDIVKNDGTHSEFMAAYEGLGWIIEAEKIKEAGIRNLHLSRLGHLAARLTRP